MPAKYSIIICTRNRALTLADALESHLVLEIPTGVSRDITVVDNGSSDQTAAVVEAFGRRAGFSVNYVREERTGHSIALNTGCRSANGEVLVFTDDDAFPERGWLAAIHDAFVSYQCDWGFGPVVPLWNGDKPNWYGPETSPQVACLDYGDKLFVARDPSTTFFGVNHACLRERLFQIGLYDERLGLRDEWSFRGNDDDLYHKAISNNFIVIYSPDVRVNHLIAEHRHNKKTHLRNAWLTGRNHAIITKDHFAGSHPWFGTPRYNYRFLIWHLIYWMQNTVQRNPSKAFYHRLRTTRCVALVWYGFRVWAKHQSHSTGRNHKF